MAVGVNVGTIMAEIRLKNEQFLAGINQSKTAMAGVTTVAEQVNQKLSTTAKVMKLVAAGYAAQKVLQFGMAMWKVGIQVEAANARFEAVFGTMGASLRRWSEENAAAFGTGADDLRGYLANVTNLLRPMGFTTQEGGKQATVVLELAKAWSAYSGGQRSVEEVIEALMRGMTGQTRGLIDLGMKITDAALEAEVLKLGLSGLTGVEKDQAEALARLNIFRERSSVALEVETELAKGALGAQRDLAAAIDQAQDAAGRLVLGLAPLITGLAKAGSVPVLGGTVMGALAGGLKFGVPGVVIGGVVGLGASLGQPIGMLDELEEVTRLIGETMRGTEVEVAGFAQTMRSLGAYGEYAGDRLEDTYAVLQLIKVAVSGVGGLMAFAGGFTIPGAQRFASALNPLGEHAGITERMAGQTIIDKAKIRRALTQPFDEAFRETTRIIREGFGAIGNLFVTFEIPEISKGEIAQNLLDWQEAQNDVAELMAALGAAGLASYGAALAAGLSPAQLAAIAAVWGGDLAYIQSLMPQYGPGGMLYQGRTYFGGGVDQPGSVGDYSVSSYATGHPSSGGGGGGGPAAPAVPGWGMGGNAFGENIVVNVGQAVGDETSIERMVTTAIRRARQRGNVRYYT